MVLTRGRRRAAAASHSDPAVPSTFGARIIVAVTNLCRSATYPQFTPPRAKFWIQFPPLGTVLLLLLYVGFVLALEFTNNNVAGAQYHTSLGIRAAWLAIAQIPLLILLAGKNNLIGLVTGLSYARLNIFHRWVSRVILLMAVLHVGILNYSWNKFGIRSLEWSTDSCVPTGFAALGILIWMNVSTIAPLRNYSYEIFVLQHLLTFFGFIIAVMYHLPSTALETRTYIWIPIGLWSLDRLVRTGRSIWNNSTQVRATVSPLDGDVTMIHVRGSRLRKWSPGSFVLLSIPQFGLVQSHPATIASTPASHGGDLVFLLRAQKGFTKNLLSSSNVSQSSILSGSETEISEKVSRESHRAFVDGPYGGTQGDFGAFDTILLVAGSTGITFALSILLDLSARVGNRRLPLRHVELVWAVKRQHHTKWVSEELQLASSRLQAAGIDSTFRVFVTCDDSVVDSVDSPRHPGCECNISVGQPCCCEERRNDLASPPDYTPRAGENHKSIVPPCMAVHSGRPSMDSIVSDLLHQAQGEMAVAVCGPLGLNTAVRQTVAKKSIKTKYGLFLHVEGFGW